MEEGRKLLSTLWQNIVKVGREDPRRVVHSLKVGIALSLVSLLYLLEPLFEEVGQNATWAVMTVVVVLEFTAGATLCKGLNRGLGTLVAGSMAFFMEALSEKSGRTVRAVFVGTSVFLVGSVTTYLRFLPSIKKNYDYGALVFLLTFNLITVSSFRAHNVMHIATERLYTIAIGSAICLLMSLLIFPNWSGEELHKSAINKLQGLARSIVVVVDDYFQDGSDKADERSSSEDQIQTVYRTVLDCKSTDETLASFASWEPRHSRRCTRFPWQQYVKLGSVLRHFGYTAAALHDCLQSEIQAPRRVRLLFRDPCVKLAHEVSRVLFELSASMSDRRRCSTDTLIDHLHQALQDLNLAISSQPRQFFTSTKYKVDPLNLPETDPPPPTKLPSTKSDMSPMRESCLKKAGAGGEDLAKRKMLKPTISKLAIMSLEFSEALPFSAFTSHLFEMVARLERVIEEVEELGRAAGYKAPKDEQDIRIRIDGGTDQNHNRRSNATTE